MTSLLSVQQLDALTVEWLLKRAQNFLEHQAAVQLRGTVVNLFFEPSTRTALSFQIAAQRLGLAVLNFDVENSSVRKGESLLDSLQTVEALGVDVAIVRHAENWPQLIQDMDLGLTLINAGSGTFEHPTQALLDALTIKQHFGGFAGLRVSIVGDIRHSRVARSNAALLKLLGAEVTFSGPEQLRPDDLGQTPWINFEEAIVQSDVVMMLRIQHERHQSWYDPEHYNERYGLNRQRLWQLKPNAIIMHPGPVNRNVEITDEVFQDPRCKILQQVTNGVAVRMAVLEWCLQGGRYEQLVPA